MDEKTFEITHTARAADVSLDTLRNWLRRDVLKYRGDEPRPSYPRMFPLAGVYEIALVRKLIEGGIDRAFAATLVQQELDKWQQLANGATLPDLTKGGWRRVQHVFEEYRDEKVPCIWVFSFSDSGGAARPIPHLKYAKGYSDIPVQIEKLQKEGKPYLLSVNRPNPQKSGEPFHTISTLNVTAILSRADALLKSE